MGGSTIPLRSAPCPRIPSWKDDAMCSIGWEVAWGVYYRGSKHRGASSGCADADPTEKDLTVLFVVSICDVALLFASKF